MSDKVIGNLYYEEDLFNIEDSASLIRKMISFATEFGLEGNIWQQLITYALMTQENVFSLACERQRIRNDSTLLKLVEPDMRRFYKIMSECPIDLMSEYIPPYENNQPTAVGKRIKELCERLVSAKDVQDFTRIITDHYEKFGAGVYGLYRAFRVADSELQAQRVYSYKASAGVTVAGSPGGNPNMATVVGSPCGVLYPGSAAGSTVGNSYLVPIAETADVTFDDLIGYESQKEALRANTEAFVSGQPANNVLLYGDSGTGKSTSVHALMHDYYDRGLRLVEIGKQHRNLLPQVLSEIKKRNYRFIIFLDDLSFEENESDYKELKAMLEGALESREDRVLIYATSNRRHLIRETWGDRADMEYHEDIHRSDTMEEKLSLASRFGVTIYYPKPGPSEYLGIVRALAERKGIKLEGKEIEDAARKWELRHGGMSGRTASQFITWLEGGN